MEDKRHGLAIEALIETVAPAFFKLRKRLDFLAGSNMLNHYLDHYTRTAKFVGPDFFEVHQEDGNYPQVLESGSYSVLKLESGIYSVSWLRRNNFRTPTSSPDSNFNIR